MDNKKIIIIGASGFIGRNILEYCRKYGIDVYGTYYKHKKEGLIKFDLLSDSLVGLLTTLEIHQYEHVIIVLCSAIASIDACKKYKELSFNINVIGTKRIIDEANLLGIKLIFLSSEAVFDGKKGYYKETDIPNPLTVYGEHKLEIEKYIIDNDLNALILRISRAASGKFADRDIFYDFYNLIQEKKPILCIKNQSFCLTHIDDISNGIIKSIENDLSGLFHLSSAELITRYELGIRFIAKYFPNFDLIEEQNLEEFSFVDTRHIKGGLDGRLLAKKIGLNFMTIDNMMNMYGRRK